jgi:hypothetical protein
MLAVTLNNYLSKCMKVCANEFFTEFIITLTASVV